MALVRSWLGIGSVSLLYRLFLPLVCLLPPTSSLRSSVGTSGGEVLRGVERFAGRSEGVAVVWRRGYYHHTNNQKVSHMRTESFSLVGLDLDDPEAVELRWNRWVGELFHKGYRPSDVPVSWTETEVTYSLVPVGGINDFNREHSLSGAA